MIDAPDTRNLACRKTTRDGKYELGVWGVMYGFRVRAGVVGNIAFDFDWCCGVNHPFLCAMYGVLEQAIDHRVHFEMPRISEIKPAHLDDWFVRKIGRIYFEHGLSLEKSHEPLPSLDFIRTRLICNRTALEET